MCVLIYIYMYFWIFIVFRFAQQISVNPWFFLSHFSVTFSVTFFLNRFLKPFSFIFLLDARLAILAWWTDPKQNTTIRIPNRIPQFGSLTEYHNFHIYSLSLSLPLSLSFYLSLYFFTSYCVSMDVFVLVCISYPSIWAGMKNQLN